jgi:hypothetical protein
VTTPKMAGRAIRYISPLHYEDTAAIPHAKQKYLTATGCPPLNITRGAAELIEDKSHANSQPTTNDTLLQNRRLRKTTPHPSRIPWYVR